ncbi:MAG: transglycosylase SLT domain-containing protein [Bacteroidia bacterium]
MYRSLPIIAVAVLFFSGVNPTEKKEAAPKSNPAKETTSGADYRRDVITIFDATRNQDVNYIHDRQLYDLRVDTMPQVKFWRSIMHLTKDSALFCHSNERCVIDKVHVKSWNTFTDAEKSCYRDSLRNQNCLSDSARILMVEGKSFFYDFSKAYVNLHQGITDFMANDVDPWYAQAILLIESPNRLQKSNVGAYGPFQLMKPVARMFGLHVNRKIDERADFDRAAYAASSLMKTICIPSVKTMLDTMCISYNETDIWFRLLVMHAYHAGAGNVRAALNVIKPTHGGMDLIQTLWHTQAKGFKTASQNYSQLVLAAMLEMDSKLSLDDHTAKN